MAKRLTKITGKSKINTLSNKNLRKSKSLSKLSKLNKLSKLTSNLNNRKNNRIFLNNEDSSLEPRRYEITSKMVEYYGYPTEH